MDAEAPATITRILSDPLIVVLEALKNSDRQESPYIASIYQTSLYSLH